MDYIASTYQNCKDRKLMSSMSSSTITPEILVAYSQCPRKAFLLLCTDERGMPHEYLRILEQQKRLNQVNYLHTLNMLKQPSLEVQSHIINDLNLNSAWRTCLPSMASSATSCVVCSTSVKTESKCSVVARYC